MRASEDIAWRLMTGWDLPTVSAVADQVHPDFWEAPEVLEERQRLYPYGSLVLELGDRIVGYVFSHPWRQRSLPSLNSLLGAIPEDADTYYLHDLALLPVVRRLGAAAQAVATLEKHARARGMASMSLVSVNNSKAFWERQGFVETEVPELYAKLLSYEESARYMVKGLA